MKYTCAVCGREFEKVKNRQTICSDECRMLKRKECERRNHMQRKLKSESEKRKSASNSKSIAEIQAEARNLGLSYGEYVARNGGI